MSKNKNRFPISASVAAFITNREGDLLFVQQAAAHKEKKWGPPAGGVEIDEDPETALKREIREEIGVEIELAYLIGVYVVKQEFKTGIAFVYRAIISNGTIQLNKKEISDFIYLNKIGIARLIDKNLLYKAAYNIPALSDFENKKSYPKEVVRF